MKPVTYVWKDGEVKTFGSSLPGQLCSEMGLLNCFIVDTAYMQPPDRVGRFMDLSRRPMWEEVKPWDLPAEFRAYLLLLGVQI